MKKLLILSFVLISTLITYGQYDVKTVNRPDGITLEYFNPIPVAITNNHEAGLSLYKNKDNNTYLLSITVLFKASTPTELNGNLIIQSTGNRGISLKPVMHKLINMNGRNIASSMYSLTNRDIIKLKSKSLELISFYVNEQPIGLSLTKNKDILIKEFSVLNDGKTSIGMDEEELGLKDKKAGSDSFFKKYDDVNSGKVKLTGKASLSNQMTSTCRGENTGLGKSKYDKDVNWDADIDKNNTQASLNTFRAEKKQKEEGVIFQSIAVVVGAILLLFLLLYFFNIMNKKEIKENLIEVKKPILTIGSQETNLNSHTRPLVSKVKHSHQQDKDEVESKLNSIVADKINNYIYQFCFSTNISAYLLDEKNHVEVSKNLFLRSDNEESFLITLFKSFVKLGFNDEIANISKNIFSINSCKFKITESNLFYSYGYLRFEIDKINTSNSLIVPIMFILKTKTIIPESIYVLVYDKLSEQYVLSNININGEIFIVETTNEFDELDVLDTIKYFS